jgi:hypothetical protein
VHRHPIYKIGLDLLPTTSTTALELQHRVQTARNHVSGGLGATAICDTIVIEVLIAIRVAVDLNVPDFRHGTGTIEGRAFCMNPGTECKDKSTRVILEHAGTRIRMAYC